MGIDPEDYRIALARREGVKASPVRRAAPTRKEVEIMKAILAYLRVVPGVVAWRQNTGAMFGEHNGKRWAVRFGVPGMSDILGWRSLRLKILDAPIAQALAIEVKREGTHPTVEQQAFLETVRRAGGIALVARNVDDVRRGLGL